LLGYAEGITRDGRAPTPIALALRPAHADADQRRHRAEIALAVGAAAEGQTVLSRDVQDRVLAAADHGPPARPELPEGLTAREADVLVRTRRRARTAASPARSS
jgi:DNA-binding NarL/FixJ family response regulator